MKESEKNRYFHIFPIGKLIIKDNRTFVKILPDYRSALKHLELFSHVLIFFEDREDKHICDISDEFSHIYMKLIKINPVNKNKISVSVCKIIWINEDEDIVELDYTESYDGAFVFDMKAYFPIEDRVKIVNVPDNMKRLLEWRPESTKESIKTEKIIDISLDMNKTYKYQISPIGKISKVEGEYYLQLTDADNSIFENLEGFSHIRILWWFHRFDSKTYRKTTQCDPPYENAPRTGVFASRSPVRPNPIAMTTAKILEIDSQKKTIKISKVDAFDNTPIIYIKPYIPICDKVKNCFTPNWLKHWPEWTEELEENFCLDTINLIESDSEKIKKIIVKNNKDVEIRRNIFEEIQDDVETNSSNIIIKGARQNNLKNISLSIPKNKITVITGVSGSGKSSLAFDTIYAESQRRFMDSISNSGKMLFEQMEKPEVEQITGLPPAIAIEQKNIGRNPRSTVGTVTDIYDYIRLLYSKIGTRYCPDCGRAIKPLNTEEIVGILERLSSGTEFTIISFKNKKVLRTFKVPNCNVQDSEKKAFIKNLKQCVEEGLNIGDGAIIINIINGDEFLLQSKNMCYHCNKLFFDLTTSTFSFNNPEGMCPICNGLGVKLEVDPKLIISKPELSILDGASQWWGNLRKYKESPNANWMRGEVLALAEEMNVDLEIPWNELPENFKYQAIYGSNGRQVKLIYENPKGRKGEIIRHVEGAFNSILRLFKENSTNRPSKIAMAFMREKQCTACKGERLSLEGRLVSIGSTRFPETVDMTIEELKNWVINLPRKLTKNQLKVANPILNELNKRLQNLIDVGVQYLTLNRSIPTLSGGEAQRLKLATQMGGGLTNLLYILDEPSIGLHPKDQIHLLKAIKRLRNCGNTIVVVEHDFDTMFIADKIIDVGPGAGECGGKIIAEGTLEEVMNNPSSKTGKYLSGSKKIARTLKRSEKKAEEWIKIFGAKHNNLKNIDVSFPLGLFTCITGVSGSGKSSLVSKTLYPALANYINKTNEIFGEHDRIEGLEKLDKVINITQLPIGRTPRSNPATYTGIFDDIRRLYASTEEAKNRGYKENSFSFNSKEGQCESCCGEGKKRVQMNFMADVWIECFICNGKRFNEEVLEIQYKNKSISDVLDMDVEEALDFFGDKSKIKKVLQTLYDVGLGYIKLGQSALTLSRGEAQRIKLAKELSKRYTEKTIYILDEPTTGLHFEDVQKLLDIISNIVEEGNTVIVIEHNIDIIKNADWIIDMGPEGGDDGGYIVAQGTPEKVSKYENSYTGRILEKFF